MEPFSSRQRFLPRCGPVSAAATVLARHQSSYSARMADRVVHACAWSDGALDVVYGDGTVLAFADYMDTFVAFPPPGAQPRTTAAGSSGVGDSCEVRDMQHTRWALSKYRAKVAAALACYNYYTAEPRLFEEHGAAAQSEVWPHAGPVDALVLARDATLLERRHVYTPITTSADALRESHQNAKEEEAAASVPLTVAPSLPLTEVSLLSAMRDPTCVVAQVCVGTEVTLWCALRRVSLTIHPRGLTFTVRWPAPVPSSPTSSSSLTSRSWSAAEVVAHEMRVRGRGPQRVVWLEQCFPAHDPPPVWAPMLQLALELHRETPSTELLTSTTPSVHDAPREPRQHQERGAQRAKGSDQPPLTSYFSLPTPRPSDTRTLGRGPRFSSMQPQHAHLLRAASLHQRGDWLWQRDVHGPTSCVLWRLDMDPAADSPPAVYWCTPQRGAVSTGEVQPDDYALSPTSVLVCAVLREDESGVVVQPHGTGYRVAHSTVDGCRREYQMTSNTGAGLPPVISSLTFSVYHVVAAPTRCESEELYHATDVGATLEAMDWPLQRLDKPLEGAMPNKEACVATLLPAQWHRRASAFPRAVCAVTSPSCAARPEPLDEDEEAALFWDTCVRSGGAGHYLKAAGRVCAELARWRSQSAMRIAASSSSCLGGGIQLGHRVERGERANEKGGECDVASSSCGVATLADRTDGSLFHHFMSTAPTAPAHGGGTAFVRADAAPASDEDSVLFLTTRLDGVGHFTALTNGVIRCHFDDRTLLTLLPGLNEFDETQLAVTCLFRNATRCVMRVSQCQDPTHAAYRYLAYALPFRRYVLMEAVSRRQGCLALNNDTTAPSSSPWADMDDTEAGPQVNAGRAPAERGRVLSPSDVNRGVPPCVSPSAADRTAVLSNISVGSQPAHFDSVPSLGLYLTTMDDTVQHQQSRDLSTFEDSDRRIQSLLKESQELRRINEALLSDA